MNEAPLFDVSTKPVDRVFPFRVDGVDYVLRTLSSLDRTEEGRLRAFLMREEGLQKRIGESDPRKEQQKIDRLTDQIRATRAEFIAMMTNVPFDVARIWSLAALQTVITYVLKEPKEIDQERVENGDGELDDEARPASDVRDDD